MEALPILIFLFIAFNVFRSITKSKGGAAATKDMMERLREAQAAQNQNWTYGKDNPSPWKNSPLKSNVPAIKKASARKARRQSHKNPKQHGRRGENVDTNRHRNHDWGQRGDSDFLSGKVLIIILVLGFIVLYALSQIPPDVFEASGQ